MLTIRQFTSIFASMIGLVLRLGIQRSAGLLVMTYRCSDEGLSYIIADLERDPGNL